MNSQQLLFINFLIFLALVLFFVFFRSKPKQPTILDLKAIPKETDSELSKEKNEKERVVEAKDVTQSTKPTKMLKIESISFIYNGHEWDAYDVLALPRGCTLQIATSHYQNLIKTSDPSTFEFFEAAFSAILKAKHN